MDVQITTRHTKTTPELAQRIQDEVDKLESMYQKVTSCHVILDADGDDQTAEIVMNAQSHTFTAKSKAATIGKAVDEGLAKIERQLKKISEKVKAHHSKQARPE
jgi:ribosomal subunit interface protein